MNTYGTSDTRQLRDRLVETAVLPVNRPYTVFGCWPQTSERHGEWLMAPDPHSAEQIMARAAQELGGVFWCCGVVAGHLTTADSYTLFVDPQDPRNLDATEVVPALAGLFVQDWTVLGFVLPAGIDPFSASNSATDPVAASAEPMLPVARMAERYADLVPATGADAAEDVARGRIADASGTLFVCAVLPGAVRRVDAYATFVDPGQRAINVDTD